MLNFLDLRAELAKHGLQKYRVAARAHMHPARLGAILRGRIPLTEQLATRIATAIQAESTGD